MDLSKRINPCVIRLLLSLIYFVSLSGAQVLSIQEIDRSGEQMEIDFVKLTYPIVDINSTLIIKINKDAVREIAENNSIIKPSIDSKQLDAITNILRKQSNILSVLGPSAKPYEQRRKDLEYFSNAMFDLLMFIQNQKTLSATVDSILGIRNISAGIQYALVFSFVRSEIEKTSQEIEKSAANERVSFRLGGWIRDQSGMLRPIHIPNYDTYDEGSFYEVPRFVMPTPKELRKQYSDAASAAREYNTQGKSALNGLNMQINTVSDTLQNILLRLNEAVKNTIYISQNIDTLKKELQPFLDQWSSLMKGTRELQNLIKEISSSSNPLKTSVSSIKEIFNLIRQINSDTKKLITQYDSALKKMQKLSQTIVKDTVDSLLAESTKAVESLKTVINDFNILVSAVEQWIQMDVPKQTEVNVEFGEKVKQFLIDDIPESTEIDLRSTGQRMSGDQLYFKAAIVNESDMKLQPGKSTEIERKTITMFQVKAHAKVMAGAVFISPFEKSKTNLPKRFQASPSYNLMVNWGMRSCYSYNTFWSPGIGINVAAPDFNLDGTPEIGLGIVVSTAKDYLQAGVGGDLGVDTWYWFFGLQIPVGTVINPSNAVPDNK